MSVFRYNTLNVFTRDGRGGNPLAVFVQAQGLSGAAMQTIARDLNLSETAFVFPARAGGRARVRIFTPSIEVPFAGHPLVGTAWILGSHLVIPRLELETELGKVEAFLERQGDPLFRASIRGPKATREADGDSAWVGEALGLRPSERGELPLAVYRNGFAHLLVEVKDPAVLGALRPNSAALMAFQSGGVLAFTRGTTVRARYFAPAFGVPEDPATGSAALALGQYLHEQGALGLGEVLTIEQGDAVSRPSTLEVAAIEEEGEASFLLGGACEVTGRGERMVRRLDE